MHIRGTMNDQGGIAVIPFYAGFTCPLDFTAPWPGMRTLFLGALLTLLLTLWLRFTLDRISVGFIDFA